MDRTNETVLFRDDFKEFPIGEFPYDRDHSATGEYHYVTEAGFHGAWYDPVCNYTWNGSGPSWIITEWQGRHFMESQRIEKNRPHRTFPTLETGSPFWTHCAVSVRLQRLSTKGMAGIIFAARDSIDCLVLSLEGPKNGPAAGLEGDSDYRLRLAYRHKEEVQVLAEAPFAQDCDTEYLLSAECGDGTVCCYADGVKLLECATELADREGRVGITADCPTRFAEFEVRTDPENAARIEARREEAAAREAEVMRQHPKMKLWKTIDLRNFGTSRQVRFGHLTGGDKWYAVFAQIQKRVNRDAYGFISCLTAVDLDGNILWQLGEPSENSRTIGKVSADMPFQVYDIDGDGIDEVICGRNFEIQILDGKTGEVRKSAKMPVSDDDDAALIGVPYNIYAFDRINPDGIRICNFRGLDRPGDILVKDRYCRVYALDSDLNLMWKYRSPKNTGHCPMPVDVNGDGKDELLVGYTLLDSQGRELWTYPIQDDHTDEIVAGKFRGDGAGYFACVSGTQGFFIGDMHGNIVARDYIGHAQRVSVANYCPERPGYEIVVSNFWGHASVIYLYDADGNEIWEMENTMNGNILAPVNWDGNGSELILTNANAEQGGLINGDGIRAVAFPDDGHPDMCVEAMDLTGDERDELIVWDYHKMYIYTQEDNPKLQQYHPVKFPNYNASNYRGEYSYPDQSLLEFKEEV